MIYRVKNGKALSDDGFCLVLRQKGEGLFIKFC